MKLNPQQFQGHPYEEQIEFVPTEALLPHREYDREVQPNRDMDEFTEDIRTNGIRQPLMVLYGKKDRRAYVGEGNHRLAAAVRLGIPAVPVRVLRSDQGYGTWEHQPGARKVPGIEPNEHNYVPADLRPSQIGLPVHKG